MTLLLVGHKTQTQTNKDKKMETHAGEATFKNACISLISL